MSKQQRVTITLDGELYDKLKHLAKAQNRSLSAQAAFLLWQAVMGGESLHSNSDERWLALKGDGR